MHAGRFGLRELTFALVPPITGASFSCILKSEVLAMRALFSVLALALCLAQFSMAQVDPRWKPNDPDRPVPPVIEPETASTQDTPGRPPSDAIVLFEGKDLSQWTGVDGQPAKWKVADGYMEVVPHSGIIQTRQAFGDCQLHVEFTEPTPPAGEGQERGNSGVLLMGL
jgi:hypothetical protein